MKKVIILKGLPASGKSTYAKNLIEENKGMYKRINKDDLRSMFDNSNWSRDNENFILKIRDEFILSALDNGKHVIVDDTNLALKHETRIRQLVKGKAKVEVVEFLDISVEECIKRDLKRVSSVGEKVIRGMYEQFLKPKIEPYKGNNNNPSAYIFDIDGTLALMKNRTPYEWEKVGQDQLNVVVQQVLVALQNQGNQIIIFTGRDGVCEPETKEWLKANHITYNHFDIRPTGNTEKDSIVKKRMFDEIKDKYNILGVFDDRNQVVEMWRDLGLTCFQVANGDF